MFFAIVTLSGLHVVSSYVGDEKYEFQVLWICMNWSE